MSGHDSSTGGGNGLERSCIGERCGWCRTHGAGEGVELFQAWFPGRAYDTHRHDTYAIGMTDAGVQQFEYRGATRASLRGDVVILHPDEPHDGRAGTEQGFGYRIAYISPEHIFEATSVLNRARRPLPFARAPVSTNETIARALRHAFRAEATPLAWDSLILELARGLLEAERGGPLIAALSHLDLPALVRGKAFLDAQLHRPVRSAELESVTGLDRYQFARQFRIRHGTSPYRYSLMRRLDAVRDALGLTPAIAQLAARFGFSDQAHLTRHFHFAYGITPGHYRQLRTRH